MELTTYRGRKWTKTNIQGKHSMGSGEKNKAKNGDGKCWEGCSFK
jgi:hypothetical protein